MRLELSYHAQVRAKQRGISLDCIQLITRLADRRHRVPGGAHALSVSDRARRRWIADGLPPAEIDRTLGVVLVAEMTAARIITVEHLVNCRRRRRSLVNSRTFSNKRK
jgi:hypothetical protein